MAPFSNFTNGEAVQGVNDAMLTPGFIAFINLTNLRLNYNQIRLNLVLNYYD